MNSISSKNSHQLHLTARTVTQKLRILITVFYSLCQSQITTNTAFYSENQPPTGGGYLGLARPIQTDLIVEYFK
jgi:hypothetical protein